MTGRTKRPLLDEGRAAWAGPSEASRRIRPDARLLNECFERACDRNPERTAVECGADRLSYAALDRQANRLAWLLMARGWGRAIMSAFCSTGRSTPMRRCSE